MRLFRRLTSAFGLRPPPRRPANVPSADKEGGDDRTAKGTARRNSSGRRFAVQVPVEVEREEPGPVLLPCRPGEGGVQGCRWYAKTLLVDDDGDVADEFLEEITPKEGSKAVPRFEVKPVSRRPRVRKQFNLHGNIYQTVESHERLQWV